MTTPSRPVRLLRAAAVLLILCAAPGVLPGVAAAAPADADPRVSVQAYAQRFAVPATVAVVLDRDGAVTTVPHGTTSDGTPVTADTSFRIASMSKAFTAVAVLQLAEAGRIDLDQPVAAALPGFTVADPRAGDITVRHLLAHTSGLSNQDVDEFALPPAASAAALVERLAQVPLAADPGTEHQYLNANYVVAARLVEVVTGAPFGEHLREAVLAPLGMTSTVATDRCDAEVPGLARGHIGALGVQVAVPEIPSFCAGDGGVVTTAADLTRWTRFQLGDGTTRDGTRLLSAAALRESQTPAPGTDGRYGLGWSVRTADDGRTRVLHGGALATYASGIEMSSAGSAAFVLTDVSGGNPGALAADLVARADGAPGVPVDDPYRTLNLALLGLTVLAAVLLGTAVLRARRRAERLAGRLLLPALSLLAGPPSATAWTLVAMLLPLSGVLALVLVLGGTAALVARSRAARATHASAV
ncbi:MULTISPECIES: serine hydrolase domain-containing protein [Pseudonocardia]|uniref:Beta-lactamase-related domain-containing protein n=2 Tax=Pseudonocardia TaxID=1847 RepID=A0ABQ0S0I9_9PSEU|nr:MULTISPECIES: serine hydrolase domain-containing protein [Pseudonocardia]OSY41845.1 putative penicillin-binding protein PbpX [Pseudonocardia autotrophica]TDN71103.1 CubicO group peptidase (beta-lactamase class C family) [Pseudonocardia autotrophica]BBG01773.1 hypothetical protein Pdca_29820 [Pseudonocardia autotrophica]GEC26278.1 hypothetical protein PSA01_33070 [Pseudonocardia saturnea]